MKWYWTLLIIIIVIALIVIISRMIDASKTLTCNPSCGIHQYCSSGQCLSIPPGDPDFDLTVARPRSFLQIPFQQSIITP